jgi:predicted nucleotidyltransferase
VTPVRAIPPDFEPAVVAAIERRLRLIEDEHKVTIVWAIESGSRAWGFPSPDSDYDCRFIFVRPLADYLSIEQKRDVIEVPIEEELDINGWDLFKMARLLLKGNAVAIEWLTSPIIYRGLTAFRDEWCREAERFVNRAALVRHYYHLGQGQFRRHMAQADAVSLKKVFYVLRPAVALRWLRLHPGRTLAPMHLPTLLAQVDLPEATRREIAALIEQKAVTREMGQGAFPNLISDLIGSEYEQALPEPAEPLSSSDQDGVTDFDRLIRRWIEACETLRAPTEEA